MLIIILIIAIIAIIVGCVIKSSMDTGKYQISIENKISQNGIRVSKRVQINNNVYREAIIDDDKKMFILTSQDSFKKYNYADIIDFDLQEDGNVISKGKAVATAIGGLTFGAVGALVGASGKQKQESTCSSLILRIRINNIQNPQLIIKYINNETKKDSMIYKLCKNNAEELVSVLSYIQNNNLQTQDSISTPTETANQISIPSNDDGASSALPQETKQNTKYSDEEVTAYVNSLVKGKMPDYSYSDVKILKTIEYDPKKYIAHHPVKFVKESVEDVYMYAIYYDGDKVGFLPSEGLTKMIDDFLKRDETIEAFFMNPDADGKFQIQIDFYKNDAAKSPKKKYVPIRKNKESKVFNLTGNKNEDMQTDISCCEVGDEVEFHYDSYDEKYSAYSGSYELGYAPKTFNKIYENADNIEAYIEDIYENDNEKLIVSVLVYYKTKTIENV